MEDQNKQSPLDSLAAFQPSPNDHRKRRMIFIGLGILGACVVSVTAAYFLTPTPQTPAAVPLVTAESEPLPVPKKTFYSPLTGLKVKDEATTKRQTTAIMIENSPDARPQSGMKEAGIVYEAVAEAGITRFLTIYQENLPGLIGPVRSLRPYYVSWLAPYNPAVAHVGGSAAALKEVRNGSYKDIDQFFNPGAYYRSADRFAPHNVYTTADRLNKLNDSKGFKTASFNTWPRKVDAPVTKPNAKNINVTISGPTYNSSYGYDAGSNSYIRSQGGAAHIDREAKKPMNPKVVIVMKVESKPGFEDGYREQITTTGAGEAFIFQDGTVQKATWQKKDTKSPLTLVAGKVPIPLNAGQVWLTAVPNSGGDVSWK